MDPFTSRSGIDFPPNAHQFFSAMKAPKRCYICGVELIPVWIDNLHRVLPKGAILPAPLLCSVTFGAATRLEPEKAGVSRR